jgi:hypothetical protein
MLLPTRVPEPRFRFKRAGGIAAGELVLAAQAMDIGLFNGLDSSYDAVRRHLK